MKRLREFFRWGKSKKDMDTQFSAVEADAFRNVMRHLVGSVTVITTENEGQLHGFTATAVCSVCATPPTILIVVNQSARTHPHIDRKGFYAVNILAQSQKGIAEHFATKGDNQFNGVDYTLSASGVPLINGAAAHIECEIVNRLAAGTHTIFMGRVIGTGTQPNSPLVYHDARYASVAHM